MSVSVFPDRHLARAGVVGHRFVVVRIAAPRAPQGVPRPPASLAFVLDRSGSMSGDKVQNARNAVVAAIGLLEPRDRIAVVAFDNEVELVVPGTTATPAARDSARRLVGTIDARGGTNLSAGWMAGTQEIALTLDRATVGRCLLLTDGQANQGITDPAALGRRAAQLRGQGISTSTFGVGADFDEGLLGRIADAGGGTFRFIDDPRKIAGFMADELGEALAVVARDVGIEVEVPSGVKVDVVGPYEVTPSPRGLRVSLPDLVSSQELEVVLRVALPPRAAGESVETSVSVVERAGVLGGEALKVSWLYADHAANDAQPRDRDVDRLVARQYAATAREVAALRNGDGDYAGAVGILRATAAKIRAYAGTDPALLRLVDELEADAKRYGEPLSSIDRKASYFQATSARRGKEDDGKSRRG